MLTSNLLGPEPGGASLLVLRNTERKKSGFIDRLLHARYRELGATLFTLDRAMAALPGTGLLGSSVSER